MGGKILQEALSNRAHEAGVLCQIARPLTEDLRLVWDSKSLSFDLVPKKHWKPRHRGHRGWRSTADGGDELGTDELGTDELCSAVRRDLQRELRPSPAEWPPASPVIPRAPFSLDVKRGDVLALPPQKSLGGSGYGAGKWVTG